MEKTKLTALGERLKIGGERLKTGGAEIGRKVGGKMKEILQVQSQEAKMVDEATADSLEESNWGMNLRICNLLNSEEFDGSEVVRAIKKRISCKSAMSQRLSLDLLETCAMNCDKVFSEVASEKVLEEIVRMINNPQNDLDNRQRALQLIKAWGNSEELAYLPIFRQTYMSVKDKNLPSSLPDDGSSDDYPFLAPGQQIPDSEYQGGPLSLAEKKELLVVARNSIEILSSMLTTETQEKPAKDDLMLSMVEKCRESQPIMQRIIESIGDDESLLFEALNLHDELQQVLSKYEELEFAYPASDVQISGDPPVAIIKKVSLSEVKEEEQKTPESKESEGAGENRNMEKKE